MKVTRETRLFHFKLTEAFHYFFMLNLFLHFKENIGFEATNTLFPFYSTHIYVLPSCQVFDGCLFKKHATDFYETYKFATKWNTTSFFFNYLWRMLDKRLDAFTWPARSPNLTPLYFYLCMHMHSLMYEMRRVRGLYPGYTSLISRFNLKMLCCVW